MDSKQKYSRGKAQIKLFIMFYLYTAFIFLIAISTKFTAALKWSTTLSNSYSIEVMKYTETQNNLTLLKLYLIIWCNK